MKYTINFFPGFCLLILLGLQSCSQKPDSANENTTIKTHEAKADVGPIDKDILFKLITNSEQSFTLVNFYATWCKPCKVELPELVDIQKDNNSDIQVILVSLDNQQAVDNKLAGFLQSYEIGFRSYVKTQGGNEFIRSLYPSWRGTIPLNLIFDDQGNLIEAMGLTDRGEVEMIVARHQTI